MSWTDTEQQVRAAVAAVANDPEGRYQMRSRFYERFGDAFTEEGRGLGASELAFLRWEIQRGVLNPLEHAQPGSPWWRAVNLDFILHAELAGAARETGNEHQIASIQGRYWLRYFQAPSKSTWYAAHNCSIVYGYRDHAPLALQENETERHFLNEVLYRVLFAQAMASGAEVSRFGKIGTLLANPRLPSVSILVSLPDFYPRHYPLQPGDIHKVWHHGLDLEALGVKILDKRLILPQIGRLYGWAAGTLEAGFLTRWLDRHSPIYPDAGMLQPLQWIGSLWASLTGAFAAPRTAGPAAGKS
ncbi:MAG: hypothetical protein NW241_13550 [Bacteroidia bacterium]|nr:hypothetical protein [Bacteroidia bacterium]